MNKEIKPDRWYTYRRHSYEVLNEHPAHLEPKINNHFIGHCKGADLLDQGVKEFTGFSFVDAPNCSRCKNIIDVIPFSYSVITINGKREVTLCFDCLKNIVHKTITPEMLEFILAKLVTK
jgi:hypothetical protein